MSTLPNFRGFDGLMTLSRREGVDIRPTLLRVLTDLYVQADTHSSEEERQFTELVSRLMDQVDDATRAAVRARLAIYPGTPREILQQLGLLPDASRPVSRSAVTPVAAPPTPPRMVAEPAPAPRQALSMQPKDAAEIHDMFFRANTRERVAILESLSESPLRAAPRIPATRAARAIEALEMAAFVSDLENFIREIDACLVLPTKLAAQVVSDVGGEPLALAARALGMPATTFQRILLFLRPEIGTSVETVYRLSRLYDRLSERTALVMLAAWRGSAMALPRPKYRPVLYDDDRQRARATQPQPRSATQPGTDAVPRTAAGSDPFRR